MSELLMMEGWTKSDAGAPLVLWRHHRHGAWATGLFRLHDEIGLSLADSLIECKKRGWQPCLGQFRADALKAGWASATIDQMISVAIADASCVSPQESVAVV